LGYELEKGTTVVAPSGYSVGLENEDIVVRLKGGVLDRESLIRFLDFLELESIRRRSQLTDEQAATLAQEIDREVWDRARPQTETS
jgi:hypothetical protein